MAPKPRTSSAPFVPHIWLSVDHGLCSRHLTNDDDSTKTLLLTLFGARRRGHTETPTEWIQALNPSEPRYFEISFESRLTASVQGSTPGIANGDLPSKSERATTSKTGRETISRRPAPRTR